jgi:glycerophosphoryl diester phosphodiesterase
MDKKRKVTWVSHRGYHRERPENTRESFQAALEMGFSAIETDLQLTKDGHLVLAHDRDLRRILGVGVEISSMPRDYLEALRFPNGERLLFFDQFAEEFFELSWTLDMKGQASEASVDALATWANTPERRKKVQDGTKFLFWSKKSEDYCRHKIGANLFYARQSECYRAGISILGGLPFLAGIDKSKIYAIPPSLGPINLFRPKYIRRFHHLGAKVIAFLPNPGHEARAALESGVDEVLTNFGIQK